MVVQSKRSGRVIDGLGGDGEVVVDVVKRFTQAFLR